MPQPTTTGGSGLMGYPSTVDTGLVAAAIYSDDIAVLVGPATTTLVTNTVYLRVIVVAVSTTILAAAWRMGATATGKTNMAIYTLAGAIVAGSDTGQIVNVASNDNKQTYATPVMLSPGIYFVALACNNNTDTYVTRGGATTLDSSYRSATNALAAAALPLTTGTLLSINLAPTSTLYTQGGLT